MQCKHLLLRLSVAKEATLLLQILDYFGTFLKLKRLITIFSRPRGSASNDPLKGCILNPVSKKNTIQVILGGLHRLPGILASMTTDDTAGIWLMLFMFNTSQVSN